MAQEITLEQELTARVFVHKFAIASGVLIREYMQKNSEMEKLEELAEEYANDIVQKSLENGTFDDLYNKAWESVKDVMPEHTKVM